MEQAERNGGRPIFFIGMPRSGTSIMFAAFAAHRDLAWFSQYMDRFPRVPGLAVLNRAPDLLGSTRKRTPRHGERRTFIDRARISPSEAYNIWRHCCGEDFVLSYLLGAHANPDTASCVRARVRTTRRLQGKPRFAAKLTGPGRIVYLSSIFPEARFVNVIRDPRAVVDSLLRVPFWRDTFRLSAPAWEGGLNEDEIRAWREHPTPHALAAVQWRAVLRTTREEAAGIGDRYHEVRYEDFVADPRTVLSRLFRFGRLADDPGAHAFVEQRLRVRDLGAGWMQRLSGDEITAIEAIAAPPPEFGYEPTRAEGSEHR